MPFDGTFYPRSLEGEKRRLLSIPKGKKHWNFSENPSRGAIHKWLNKWYGRANRCIQEGCDGTSKHYEWAKIKGKRYIKNISNYQMMCRKCHTKYDMTEKRKSSIVAGIKKRYEKNRP